MDVQGRHHYEPPIHDKELKAEEKLDFSKSDLYLPQAKDLPSKAMVQSDQAQSTTFSTRLNSLMSIELGADYTTATPLVQSTFLKMIIALMKNTK